MKVVAYPGDGPWPVVGVVGEKNGAFGLERTLRKLRFEKLQTAMIGVDSPLIEL